MNSKILLVGGGGHCKSVLDSLLESNQYSYIGIIDTKDNIGKYVMDIPVIGCDEDLRELYYNGYNNAFITIGSIGDASLRIKLLEKIEKVGFNIPNIIDSTAIVSKYISMETGIYIGKNVVINNGTSIEKGAIINTSTTIEHECFIKQCSHIAPCSVLCGGVEVGASTLIGARSAVKQQVKIGSHTIIGMGSVVLHNIGDNKIAYGNPCREVRSR